MTASVIGRAGLLLALLLAGRAEALDFPDPAPEEGGRPPRFIVVPTLRLSVRQALDAATTIETYVKPVIGMSGRPFAPQVAQGAFGLSLARGFGDWSWSVGVEATSNHDGFFRDYASSGLELSSQLGRTLALAGTPWSLGPRLTVSYRWSDDPLKERPKVELALPAFYRISDALDAVLVARVDSRAYVRYRPVRADLVAGAAAGLRYEVRRGVLVSAFMGFENRWSSLPEMRYARWLIVPQLSLRADF